MSRSRRKTPIIANASARSDKDFKQLANRRFRYKTKKAIINETNIWPNIKSVADAWCDSDKDGKHWMKSNSLYFKTMMRK